MKLPDRAVLDCIDTLIDMISQLGDRVAQMERFPDTVGARRKFITQLGQLNGFLEQAEPEAGPSDHEDRIATLEEHHAERERDRARPLHVTIKKSEIQNEKA